MTSAAAANSPAPEMAETGEALCLPDTDWLEHRLTIRGPAEELAQFRTAAAGAGVIPWQLEFEQLQEDWFHRLMGAPSRSLSAQGARVLAQQLREVRGRSTGCSSWCGHTVSTCRGCRSWR